MPSTQKKRGNNGVNKKGAVKRSNKVVSDGPSKKRRRKNINNDNKNVKNKNQNNKQCNDKWIDYKFLLV